MYDHLFSNFEGNANLIFMDWGLSFFLSARLIKWTAFAEYSIDFEVEQNSCVSNGRLNCDVFNFHKYFF